MSGTDESNIHVLWNAPEDSPEKQAVIETLLWALEEVRRDRICSIALVGVSENYQRSIRFTEGVRMDHTPHVMGLLEMLMHDLKAGYDDAIEEFAVDLNSED